MKIAILVNEDTMDVCTGKGCFNAFNKRIDAFKDYGTEVELVAFTHVGGDLERKIEKLINNSVEVVHLSTCLRAKYEDYDNLAHRLAKDFKVVGYTHGSENGKNRDTICLEQCKGCKL
ncbi:CGGC domain-containing protein [Clostridium sp.]|uniref:CGGC domain-containing protein n=1 Tax=Clostridium sp. TaxID=1506 RepID=UPI002FC82BEC